MNTMQRGGLQLKAHRCIVAYGLSIFLLSVTVAAKAELSLEDFAEININQYFEPKEELILSGEGKKKAQALAYYSVGRSHEAKGQLDEAIKSYRKVLENQPDQFFLARKTAYLLARNGSNDEALKLLEENLENNPNEPFSHIALSEYLVTYQSNEQSGRDRAFSVIEEAVDQFPDEPAVYEHLVKLYLMNNQREEARELIARAAARGNSDVRFWLRLGAVAVRAWPRLDNSGPDVQRQLVNDIYAKALKSAGNDMRAVETVGDYYHATRQFDPAIRAYVEVIGAMPDQLKVRLKLAHVYGAKGDEEKVIMTLKEILEIDPESSDTHKRLAQIYMSNEDYLAAIPHLRKSLEITKGTATEYGALARMMIESEEHEAAIEFMKDAAYLFPENPDFPFLLTFSLGRLERWEESIEEFKKTVELAGDEEAQILNESFFFRYAAAHERFGNIEEAEKLFQKTIEMISKKEPDEQNSQFAATVYNYLGYMWLENDMNLDEAGELIKTAVDLDPESGAIADSLGWYYFKRSRFEEAKAELLRAEQLIEESDPVIFDHIAQAFYMLGEREEALDYMRKAVEMDPENQEFKDRLKSYEASPPKIGKPETTGESAPEADSAELKPAA
ncbi:MAG: tetratricopeptide repeat protein [Verrucomicrobiales bacterium]|nr:tetratricopeptide repeat protein [Verrucomicrobiales bacterium]